jgi:type II secretory pathway pseudopilin PulG
MMRDEGGYSLIEMLAALILLGTTFVFLASGVGTSRRVWERLDAQADGVSSVVSAQSLLRDRLEQAFPQTRFDASAPYADFRGEAGLLAFLSPATASQGPQALRRYALSMSPAGELVLTSASDTLPAEAPPQERRVLLKGVGSIALSYWGKRADKTSGWMQSWRSQSVLPSLVRLDVQFSDGRYWPVLLVHPAATVDSLCVLDVVKGHCRGRA